jgi:hypothetical protein
LLAYTFLASLVAVAVAFETQLHPGLLKTLRDLQAQDLKLLYQNYHTLGVKDPAMPGANKFFDNAYNTALKEVRSKYLSADPRPAEINQLLTDPELQGKLRNTGSMPKDVRADVDLAASDGKTADAVARRWRSQYGDALIGHSTDLRARSRATAAHPQCRSTAFWRCAGRAGRSPAARRRGHRFRLRARYRGRSWWRCTSHRLGVQ